jgi:hypothetical protein
VPTIEERLARLEQLAAPEETTQPTFFTVDPATGLVTASVAGIIHAIGLILDTATTPVGGDPNRIQWKRPADAVKTADLWSYSSGGREVLQIGTYPTPAADSSEIFLYVGDGNYIWISDNPNNVAGAPTGRQLQLFSGAGSVNSAIQLRAPASGAGNTADIYLICQNASVSQQKTLLNVLNQSNFVQAMSVNNQAPRLQRMGFMSQASGTGSLAASWQQMKTTSLDRDPDGLMAWNGVGYYLLAPEQGDYLCMTTCMVTNGVGGNLDFITGFQTSFGGFNIPYSRMQIPNTLYGAFTASFIYALTPGQWVTPALWLSSVAGFGVTQNEGYFQVQRVG